MTRVRLIKIQIKCTLYQSHTHPCPWHFIRDALLAVDMNEILSNVLSFFPEL